MSEFLSIKWIVVYVFVICTLVVHFRGKKRLRFLRQLGDQSMFMAPINCLMYLFSKVPNRPYQDLRDFPELAVFRDHWQVIREEGLKLMELGAIKTSNRHDDAGFNTFFKRGWKRFYLKWYDQAHPSAQLLCPETVRLLEGVPSVKAAMYTYLPAGAKLGAHRDPFAGSLRYHLGLVTPNSEDCFILVDGQKYAWRDGEDVLFDETFIHEAHNQTDQGRLIFFCDVLRPMRTSFGRGLNAFFSNTIMKAASAPNSDEDRTGFINKIFKYFNLIREAGQALKRKNRRLYYLVKYCLLLVIVSLIVWA
jgi:beta-hydroxylase